MAAPTARRAAAGSRRGPARFRGTPRAKARRHAAGALVQVHRLVVLGERAAEGVRAVVAAHEVEVLAGRRTQHGANRLDPRRADRSGRQARPLVGVVRRVDREVLLADVAVEAAGLAQRIDDGGVGLQQHALAQAVQEHPGDARPFAAARRFHLHQRGQRDDLPQRHPARRDRLALGCDHLAEALHHAHDQRLLGRVDVGRDLVGVGEQVTLEVVRRRVEVGDCGGIAGQVEEGGGPQAGAVDDFRHLAQRASFGKGHALVGGLAAHQHLDDVGERQRAVHRIVARAQAGPRALQVDEGPEHPRIAHQAETLQLPADALAGGALRHGERQRRLAHAAHRQARLAQPEAVGHGDERNKDRDAPQPLHAKGLSLRGPAARIRGASGSPGSSAG